MSPKGDENFHKLVREREFDCVSLETTALGSFALLCLRIQPGYQDPFDLNRFKLVTTGETFTAIVKITASGREMLEVCDGKTTVKALAGAFQKCLKLFYPRLADTSELTHKVSERGEYHVSLIWLSEEVVFAGVSKTSAGADGIAVTDLFKFLVWEQIVTQ